MKKLVVLFMLLCGVSFAFANPPISEKVLKNFADVFPGIQNAKWYEYENYYDVYFDNNDIKCHIKYDLDGKIISTIRYYDERAICPFLKAKLGQKYPGKKIYGVTEINTENEVMYDIVLEDDHDWMHVQSDGIGQMATTQKFKKATP